MAQKTLELPPDIDFTIKNHDVYTDYTFVHESKLSNQFATYIMDLFFEGKDILFESKKFYIYSFEFKNSTSEFCFRLLDIDAEKRQRKIIYEFTNIDEIPHYDSLAKLKS